MFRSDALEAFTHMHPATPWFIGVPILGAMAWWAFWIEGISLLAFPGLFLTGLLIWTFFEYVLHRFVFHYEPRSARGKKLHFMVHGVHHDYPNDATRLVMPPGLSIPLGIVFFAILWTIFGAPITPAIFMGVVVGYIAYDTVHYRTHHKPMKSRLGRAWKRYHMRHHFADPDTGYGVSTPLWDVIFRTRPKRDKQ